MYRADSTHISYVSQLGGGGPFKFTFRRAVVFRIRFIFVTTVMVLCCDYFLNGVLLFGVKHILDVLIRPCPFVYAINQAMIAQERDVSPAMRSAAQVPNLMQFCVLSAHVVSLASLCV